MDWKLLQNDNKYHSACVHAQLLHLCLTLCDPMDCSLPGSSFHGFSRQKYWSGVPCPPLSDLPDPGIKPWVSRVSSVSCNSRWVLYHQNHLGRPNITLLLIKTTLKTIWACFQKLRMTQSRAVLPWYQSHGSEFSTGRL